LFPLQVGIHHNDRGFIVGELPHEMKRQGQRTDLTLSPVATKLDTAAQLGRQSGESRDQVFRFIRLTNLIPEILELTGDKVKSVLCPCLFIASSFIL